MTERLRPLGVRTTADLAALPPEVARDVGTVVLERLVRELNGDVYFGEKGRRTTAAGLREGHDQMRYDEAEVARIARVGQLGQEGGGVVGFVVHGDKGARAGW